MKPTVFMHSVLAPDALAGTLRRSIDPEHFTLFSLSGYKGDRPILGEVDGKSFRLQKRRYSRNDFAGHFYGTFEEVPTLQLVVIHAALSTRHAGNLWVAGQPTVIAV
jgi:hypothetical protein